MMHFGKAQIQSPRAKQPSANKDLESALRIASVDLQSDCKFA